YRTATAEGAEAGAVLLYLIPDMILADGSMRTMGRHLAQGKRAVMVAGLRAAKDSLLPEVLSRFAKDGIVSVPPRRLVSLAVGHLHPIMQDHLYDGPADGFNPSFFCWPVANEGYVVRCAHLQPVLVDFRGRRATLHGTIDDDLLFDL